MNLKVGSDSSEFDRLKKKNLIEVFCSSKKVEKSIMAPSSQSKLTI